MAGMRGFGSLDKDVTYTDAQSGQLYAQWLQDAAANPYVAGVEWFEYHDQPVTGNADNGDVMPASLVIGQNQAFGMIDVTLQPKYDLVNAVRAANIATLQSLGLLGTAPMLTSAPANGATYLSGRSGTGIVGAGERNQPVRHKPHLGGRRFRKSRQCASHGFERRAGAGKRDRRRGVLHQPDPDQLSGSRRNLRRCQRSSHPRWAGQ